MYFMQLKKFLKSNKDKDEVDYLNHEILKLNKILEVQLSEKDLRLKIISEMGEGFKNPKDNDAYIERKVRHELAPIRNIHEMINDYEIRLKRFNQTNKEDLIDFSDSKGTEKIIFLQQLGILDFLKNQQPFMQSTNKLAQAISTFTGEKVTTIQSYINPMNDPTSIQKNNPLTKEKLVAKVNQKLISIGYNPPQ